MNWLFCYLVKIMIFILMPKKVLNGFNAVSIDFDGTIFPTGKRLYNSNFNTPPDPIIIDYINWLYDNGFKVYIHTSRVIFKFDYRKVKKYLDRNNIKYELITPIKFPVLLYIDDRAYNFIADYDEHNMIYHEIILDDLKKETRSIQREVMIKRKLSWGF